MIKIIYTTDDCGEFFANHPEVEMRLKGNGYHAAYMANLFRDFMLAVGFTENTVNEYIPDVGIIESHIENRFKEKFNEILEESTKVSEESTKVSEESADNVTSPKKDVSTWTIEDWRVEFERWMKEVCAWDAYVEANNSLSSVEREMGIREPLCKLDCETNFLYSGFDWDEHEQHFNMDEWETFQSAWQKHISDLKGE